MFYVGKLALILLFDLDLVRFFVLIIKLLNFVQVQNLSFYKFRVKVNVFQLLCVLFVTSMFMSTSNIDMRNVTIHSLIISSLKFLLLA
jgi:hypothetical protein